MCAAHVGDAVSVLHLNAAHMPAEVEEEEGSILPGEAWGWLDG